MGNAQPGGGQNPGMPPGADGQQQQIPGGGPGQYPGGYMPNQQQQNLPPGIPPGGGYQINPPPQQHPHSSYTGAGAPDYRHYQQQQQPQQPQQQQMYGQAPMHSMKKSSSDTSMTFMDGDPNMKQGLPHSQSAPRVLESIMDDDTVPTVFRWEHGGRQVYITGTFNGWSRQIPMHRSGNDFTYIHNLKRGKHAFKFIVDDEWRFAPDQPTVADIEGRINNFIDVTDFKAYRGDRDFEKEKAAADYGAGAEGEDTKGGPGGEDEVKPGAKGKPDKDGEIYSHNMPDVDDYTKEPPPLPPHLRHIILNKPPQLQDTAALPVPQHVALNHLYCTAIKDNMMVLGITQRFKTKFVTTVYYSPCSSN